MASRFEVRVLCCRASPSGDERDLLRSAITADEEHRVSRFVRQVDADRFLVGRGTLRREVGRVLGVSARAVQLELGPQGKPHVIGGPEVNVSHAGEVVLVAVSSGAPIGVDVELVDERLLDRGVAETSFSARELADLPRA